MDDGFAGLFALGRSKAFARNWKDPVLAACTDGVGTKLKLAFALNKHDTVGIDCVAMSINDMLCMGAEPLFFLDYIATGKKDLGVLLPLVSGVIEGCKQAGCALLGGETAEMPGFYPDGEYDIAGFGVGVVERNGMLKGDGIKPGDVLVGLSSSGLHSNGFSLARKIVDRNRWQLSWKPEGLGGTLGEVLLAPTVIYARPVGELLRKGKGRGVVGLANITGGGFPENIPRILPKGCQAVVNTTAWEPPPVFGLLQQGGQVDRAEMYHVFNMGIGMVLVVDKGAVDRVTRAVNRFRFPGLARISATVIGEVRKGPRKVVLK